MTANIPAISPAIDEKVFLVTGGAAGIGAGIVRGLLAENAWHVAFVDILEREGVALEKELLAKFGALRTKFIKCDIADCDQLDAAYRQVLEKYNRIDGVINNAGVLSSQPKLYSRMINVNFTATVNSTVKALDMISSKDNEGFIVNISSLQALRSETNLPVYSATKTAVLQFTNSIAAANENSGIRIMTICLGPTDTGLYVRQKAANFNENLESDLDLSEANLRQRVESAVSGVIGVIKYGRNGSTWAVSDDKPALDITNEIKEGFAHLSKTIREK